MRIRTDHVRAPGGRSRAGGQVRRPETPGVVLRRLCRAALSHPVRACRWLGPGQQGVTEGGGRAASVQSLGLRPADGDSILIRVLPSPEACSCNVRCPIAVCHPPSTPPVCQDVSRIDEMPPGRTPVVTKIVEDDTAVPYTDPYAVRKMEAMWQEVLRELTTGEAGGGMSCTTRGWTCSPLARNRTDSLFAWMWHLRGEQGVSGVLPGGRAWVVERKGGEGTGPRSTDAVLQGQVLAVTPWSRDIRAEGAAAGGVRVASELSPACRSRSFVAAPSLPLVGTSSLNICPKGA